MKKKVFKHSKNTTQVKEKKKIDPAQTAFKVI